MLTNSFMNRKTRSLLFGFFLSIAVIFILLSQAPISVKAAAADTSVLHVVGNKLIDGADHVIRLTGVNIPSLSWSNVGEDPLAKTLVALDDWKANTIRLALNQDFWFGYGSDKNTYQSIVDSIVQAVTDRNKYIILDLHWSDMGSWGDQVNQHKMPDDNSTTFWTDVAGRYKNIPNVLFGLYNEPHDVSWSVWKDGGSVTEGSKTYHTPGNQSLIDTIRSAGAKNIVIAAGLDWSNDLTGVNTNALVDTDGKGIILVFRALTVAGKINSEGKGADLSKYTDNANISAYALNSVSRLVEEGIIIGTGKTIEPTANTSRAQAAVILYNIYNK